MESKDIEGLDFTVTSNNGGGPSVVLTEDEWYPANLTGIEKSQAPFGPVLNWNFALVGEEYSYEYNDEKQQLRVRGNTSLILSPKSKMYKWYTKLTGKEPTEGEKISLSSLFGIPCYVMVKITKSKNKEGKDRTYYNVDKLKTREGEFKGQVKKVKEVKPETVASKTKKPVKTEPIVTPDKNEEETTRDIFSDIF